MIKSKQYVAVFQAILAAALFGISSPVSKFLLEKIPPMIMAALLYLGAGIGMLIMSLMKNSKGIKQKEAKIGRKELPFTIGMIALDIAAPIFLMIGLSMTTASNASLLNNFEIVATSLIALLIFKESIGKRLWIAIFFITVSSIILSVADFSSFSFSIGSIFVLLACICWGFENNCTRMMSLKDPMQIVVIKGLGSGVGSLIIAFLTKEYVSDIGYIFIALILGFFAYGLSIFFYITAQRELGAARTSAYYAVAPFIGVGLSLLMYNETITWNFVIAVILMIFGAYYAAVEKHNHNHTHEIIKHEHRHNHNDGHHNHTHEDFKNGEHSHEHTHELIEHTHSHTPDMHHDHSH
ncbi:DMT family transporter [Romboutsia sp.]|uniref:DMT family transporter n=1 Tax=Romboutsia sp. TaxID=1965302 RepID=UPI002BB68487|nr:DMT family transporter [Romboutsia sp.]HSQ89819.1 DMT family transporter [Romboutsia sp.]